MDLNASEGVNPVDLLYVRKLFDVADQITEVLTAVYVKHDRCVDHSSLALKVK